MLLATTQVEDVDRFIEVFSTKGAEKRKLHGSKGCSVFRDPSEEDRVWAIFDWDAEGWKSFVSDPEVPPILQAAGHKGKPQSAMVRIDRQEEGEARAEKIANLAHRTDRIRQEIQRLQDMERALKEAPDSQISLTDPDSRSMATSAKGSGFVGYNAQAAVDTESHLIVTHDVIDAGHDREQLSSMAKGAKAVLGRDEMRAVADKGYFSGREILACHEDGITTTLPRPETSGNRKKGMYVKADFAYDSEADVYRCPAGEALRRHYTTKEQGLVVHRYWTNVCQTCEIKARCTTGKERRITRWEHEHLIDEMRDRLSRDPNLMGLRRSTAEHPFGTIKTWMGATHFRMRTLRNVRTEMAFHVLAYNIKRMISLIGVRGLLAAIPA